MNSSSNERSILRDANVDIENEMEQDILDFNQSVKERRRGTLFNNPR